MFRAEIPQRIPVIHAVARGVQHPAYPLRARIHLHILILPDPIRPPHFVHHRAVHHPPHHRVPGRSRGQLAQHDPRHRGGRSVVGDAHRPAVGDRGIRPAAVPQQRHIVPGWRGAVVVNLFGARLVPVRITHLPADLHLLMQFAVHVPLFRHVDIVHPRITEPFRAVAHALHQRPHAPVCHLVHRVPQRLHPAPRVAHQNERVLHAADRAGGPSHAVFIKPARSPRQPCRPRRQFRKIRAEILIARVRRERVRIAARHKPHNARHYMPPRAAISSLSRFSKPSAAARPSAALLAWMVIPLIFSVVPFSSFRPPSSRSAFG